MSEIGLFPLGIVLLPGERVPLHVFEPRYKELIGECLEEGREFGLVFEDEDGMRDVGTIAAVVEVIRRFPDGRMNVVIEGRERFHVVEETAGRAFRTAQIAPVEDVRGEPTEREVTRCLAAYRRLAETVEADADEPERGARLLSFWIAARVDFGPEAKQELLELRSERDRVVRLAVLLARARELVRFAKTARQRAERNGRVEPPG